MRRFLMAAMVFCVTLPAFGCALHVTGSEVRIDDLTKRISELEAKTDAHERNWQRTGEWSAAVGERLKALEPEKESSE